MSRLTPFSKLLLAVLIGGGIFYGLRQFLPKTDEKKADATEQSTQTGSSTTQNGGSTSDNATKSTPSVSRQTFDYSAPVPSGGVLKGVVELGATGFNSFVVRVDAAKNWKLEKAEFGNSLVYESMSSDDDIRIGLKKYINSMLENGVNGKQIHFVVSSGALKSDATQKIIKGLQALGYFVNTVTPEQEGKLGLKCVLPKAFESNSFVVDIGSGNTKISWIEGGAIKSFEAAGSKYFQLGTSDEAVAAELKKQSAKVPASKRQNCFIIGGVPFDLAKTHRNGKERFTILNPPSDYKGENAKVKAGLNIYKSIADETGCNKFIFDWDSNFTIGFLLGL